MHIFVKVEGILKNYGTVKIIITYKSKRNRIPNKINNNNNHDDDDDDDDDDEKADPKAIANVFNKYFAEATSSQFLKP